MCGTQIQEERADTLGLDVSEAHELRARKREAGCGTRPSVREWSGARMVFG
jgi:hypothetical protein